MGATGHVLVVGGTGMLREATLALAARHRAVSVIARGEQTLLRLASEAPGTIHPLALDYRDGEALAEALAATQACSGPIDVAVCWIHSVAPEAPRQVAAAIARARQSAAGSFVYVHVLGSASADPSRDSADERARFDGIAGIDYRQVILGFVLERDASRWLTEAEIGAGVLAALESGAERSVVGVVRPWSRRP